MNSAGKLKENAIHSFTSSVSRTLSLGILWYTDVKGPLEKALLVQENIYVFEIIEATTRYLIQFYI